jgi:hypothetical protein
VDRNQSSDQLFVEWAVSREQVVVLRLAPPSPGTDLIAGNIELAGAETHVFEVIPERAGWGAQSVPQVCISVDGLEGHIELRDAQCGGVQTFVEDMSLRWSEIEPGDEHRDLVEPGEVIEPGASAFVEELVDLPQRQTRAPGVERTVRIVFDELPERDKEAVVLVRPRIHQGRRTDNPCTRVREECRQFEFAFDPCAATNAREGHRHAGDHGRRPQMNENIGQIPKQTWLMDRQSARATNGNGRCDCSTHALRSNTCHGRLYAVRRPRIVSAEALGEFGSPVDRAGLAVGVDVGRQPALVGSVGGEPLDPRPLGAGR